MEIFTLNEFYNSDFLFLVNSLHYWTKWSTNGSPNRTLSFIFSGYEYDMTELNSNDS